MKRFFLCLIIISIAAAGILSCGTAPVITGTESDAETTYKEGLYYLEKDDLGTAEARFMKVISDFSYSKFEPYATVALGNTYYKKGEYMSAITVFETFLKRHPNHEKAPEAELQKANSYFAQRPSDFFMLPDPSERDITVVETAVTLYHAYLEKYPEDSGRAEGEENLGKAEAILIEKDLRIAEFYAKKKKCAGVFLRLQHIENNFKITTQKNSERINKLLTKCPAKSKDEYFNAEEKEKSASSEKESEKTTEENK